MRKAAAILACVVAGAFLLLAAHAQTPAWKQLFNGKDLTGWKHVGPGDMTVEEGLIRTHGGVGLLYWAGREAGRGETAASTWSTRCATSMTIPACLFGFRSSRGSLGCPCTTDTKCRSTI